MQRIPVLIVLILSVTIGCAFAQHLSGTYTLSTQGVMLTLDLREGAGGTITGSLSSTAGIRFQVEGMVQDGVGMGACYNEQASVFFEARQHGNQVTLSLIEPDANNMPDYNKVRQFIFTRQAGEDMAGRKSQKPDAHGQAGPPQPSAQEVSDPNWGFAFTPPEGWKYQKGYKGAVLGHEAIAGMILIFPHLERSLQEVHNQMRTGLSEEEVQLMLTGSLQKLGNNAFAGDYTGIFQGQRVTARGIGTASPYGGGAFIVALTTPEKFGPQLSGTADAIARGMRYLEVDVAEPVRHFAGRWASYSGGSGGGTLVNYFRFLWKAHFGDLQ